MSNIDRKISDMELILGRVFANKLLAAEALNMAGDAYLPLNGRIQFVPKNQSLAILGDSVTHGVLCQMWYEHRDEHGSRLSKGQWTSICQDVLTNENLARVGRALRIDQCIIQHPGSTGISDGMVSTTVEAILAAVYLDAGDQGLDALRTTMSTLGLDNHSLLMVPLNNTLLSPP